VVLALLLLVAAHAGVAGPPASTGTVYGRVTLDLGEGAAAPGDPIVVYLDAVDGELNLPPPKETVRISQKNARFSPSFVVVARGQTVEMPNDDAIFHNVFSFSRPNQLDLGLYPKGEHRSVAFSEPGAVRLYCSIHESMSATIFVAPSALHATADATGAFRIAGVPRGTYRVRTWSERLPEASRQVEVSGGRDVEVALPIGGRPVGP
jgi:plastocyanin